jgi:hypothetical protein
MYDNGDIDDKTLEYLISDRPIPGRLYLLPKIHKANNPGRLIVFGVEGGDIHSDQSSVGW